MGRHQNQKCLSGGGSRGLDAEKQAMLDVGLFELGIGHEFDVDGAGGKVWDAGRLEPCPRSTASLSRMMSVNSQRHFANSQCPLLDPTPNPSPNSKPQPQLEAQAQTPSRISIPPNPLSF